MPNEEQPGWETTQLLGIAGDINFKVGQALSGKIVSKREILYISLKSVENIYNQCRDI
jgi:hypothetical protein